MFTFVLEVLLDNLLGGPVILEFFQEWLSFPSLILRSGVVSSSTFYYKLTTHHLKKFTFVTSRNLGPRLLPVETRT